MFKEENKIDFDENNYENNASKIILAYDLLVPVSDQKLRNLRNVGLFLKI